MHDQGKGVRQDHAQAARWYRTAADQGDAHAQHSLAVCYLIGEGVERDPARAARWFRRAAQQGHEGAQCELGLLYETGDGVPCDVRRALHWYRLAAVQGMPEAVARLAIVLSRTARRRRKADRRRPGADVKSARPALSHDSLRCWL